MPTTRAITELMKTRPLPPIRQNTAPAILITNYSREPRRWEVQNVSFVDGANGPLPNKAADATRGIDSKTNKEITVPSVPKKYLNLLRTPPRPPRSIRAIIREGTPIQNGYSGTGDRNTFESRSISGRPDEEYRMRVKIHCGDEVRGMALTPEVQFEEFVDRIHGKLGDRKVCR
ncbi:hypothetical protein FRC17_006217 [Serendipita sp. 399]|nr:hypothetical protein FRC17_006217 [Serendipita sp. 399]